MKLFTNRLPFAAIARKTVQENQRGRGLSGMCCACSIIDGLPEPKVAATSARHSYRLPPAQSPLSPGFRHAPASTGSNSSQFFRMILARLNMAAMVKMDVLRHQIKALTFCFAASAAGAARRIVVHNQHKRREYLTCGNASALRSYSADK